MLSAAHLGGVALDGSYKGSTKRCGVTREKTIPRDADMPHSTDAAGYEVCWQRYHHNLELF